MPEDKKVITVRVSPDEHKKIKILAAETGKTIKQLFLEGIAGIVQAQKASRTS